MTSIKLSLVAVALGVGVASHASAQDAAAPFRRDSPTPAEQAATPAATATPAQTPEATPIPTPASVATTPQPAETPARVERSESTATPTPAGRVIREKPVRAMERRPASAPPSDTAAPSATESAEPRAFKPTFDLSPSGGGYAAATVRALENRWQAALVKHDAATIDELVADDFIGTSSTGRVGSKSTLLNEVRRDENKYTSGTARGMIARDFGQSVVVVAGTSRVIGTTPDGQRFDNSSRFTDTWMLRGKRWQCVASHATQLPKK